MNEYDIGDKIFFGGRILVLFYLKVCYFEFISFSCNI